MNAIEKVRSLVEQIRTNKEPLKLLDTWQLAGRLLGRMPVDGGEVERVVREMDLEGLDGIVGGLEHPAAVEKAEVASDPDVTHAEKTAAMHAFRKRMKLARLSDESRLGGRYTSGGRVSKIDAIEAPREIAGHVWRALVKDGQLEDTGGGFYRVKK